MEDRDDKETQDIDKVQDGDLRWILKSKMEI